jgi:PAS domain S-box-containing protein
MKNNDLEKTTLSDPIHHLSQQVGKLLEQLIHLQTVSPEEMQSLSDLEKSLSELGEKAKVLEEEHNKLLALANTTQAVNSSLRLDEVLCVVMDTIVRLTGAERGFLMLMDPQGEMVTHIARNWEQESIQAQDYAISRTIIDQVIRTGGTVLTTNARQDARFRRQESIVTHNLRSILCVPLRVKDELIGVLYTDNRIRSGIFTASDKELLTAFANQAAVAIENARLYESIHANLAEVVELKDLMDNIFTSIGSAVITVDLQAQVMQSNHAAESLLGLSNNEMVGRNLADLIPSLARDLCLHIDEVIRTDRQIRDLDLSQRMPELGQVEWRIHLSPLKDADQTTRGVAIVMDDMTERKKLEEQRRLLERMVSPAVLQQLDPNSLLTGGTQSDIAILFADLRGFTQFGERHTPQELVSVLNQYLAAAADAILAEEGTVDKYLGDSVMAWFNAPLLQPDHTMRAVRAALSIRRSVLALHARLPLEAHLSFGVGIHFGRAVLGLIGTEKRIDYTAIGDSVNTTKRIQENAGADQILLSQDAYLQVKDLIQVKQIAPLLVKGKTEPIQVYELHGLHDLNR